MKLLEPAPSLLLKEERVRTVINILATSLYFEGRGGESIGKRGHNKDQRPDLYQMVVGMALDVEGRPICCEMWPGNTADVCEGSSPAQSQGGLG